MTATVSYQTSKIEPDDLEQPNALIKNTTIPKLLVFMVP
jgi:hypothetical protein